MSTCDSNACFNTFEALENMFSSHNNNCLKCNSLGLPVNQDGDNAPGWAFSKNNCSQSGTLAAKWFLMDDKSLYFFNGNQWTDASLYFEFDNNWQPAHMLKRLSGTFVFRQNAIKKDNDPVIPTPVTLQDIEKIYQIKVKPCNDIAIP